MARKALKAINWAAIIERVPETEKAALAAFKSKSDKYLQRMMSNPETPPKIDWEYYRKTVTTPGVVDKFQKEYEALSIPYPADKYTAEIETQKQEIAKKIQDFIQDIDVGIEEAKSNIKELNSWIPFAEMTMDDYMEYNPEGFLRTDKVTTWPHTEESQEDLDDDEDDDDDH